VGLQLTVAFLYSYNNAVLAQGNVLLSVFTMKIMVFCYVYMKCHFGQVPTTANVVFIGTQIIL